MATSHQTTNADHHPSADTATSSVVAPAPSSLSPSVANTTSARAKRGSSWNRRIGRRKYSPIPPPVPMSASGNGSGSGGEGGTYGSRNAGGGTNIPLSPGQHQQQRQPPLGGATGLPRGSGASDLPPLPAHHNSNLQSPPGSRRVTSLESAPASHDTSQYQHQQQQQRGIPLRRNSGGSNTPGVDASGNGPSTNGMSQHSYLERNGGSDGDCDRAGGSIGNPGGRGFVRRRGRSIWRKSKTALTKSDGLSSLVAREFAATTIHASAACCVRAALSLLVSLSTCHWSNTMSDLPLTGASSIGIIGGGIMAVFAAILGEVIGLSSALARWISGRLPDVSTAPGFVFASGWLLFPISDKIGPMPSVPVRICETVLGRLTPRELAVVLPVHFLGAVTGASLVRILLPASLEHLALEPVVYSESNPWTVDFVREVVASAIFTVLILVLPELAKLNSVPRSVVPILLIPLASSLVGVDAMGIGSTFAPDILYALRCVSRHEEVPLRQSSHLLGPVVGGWFAGRMMTVFFPDPPMDR